MARFAAIVCFLLAVVVFASKVKAETWRLTALHWPPYSSPALKGGGSAIAALRKALDKIGITLKVDYMSFPRAQALAETNDYVGYFPAWPEEIRKGFSGSRPIFMSQIGVVHRAGTPVIWKDAADLFLNHRIGFVRSFVYPDLIQNEINERYTQLAGADNEQDLVRMLAANRIDAAITDPNVMLHVAADLNINGLVAAKRVLFRKPLVVAFSGSNQNDMRKKRLNKALPFFSRNELTCCDYIPAPAYPKLPM